MEFGIEKRAMLVMEKEKILKSVGIRFRGGKSLQEGENYKYLRVLEEDRFLEEKMKVKVSKEYLRSFKKSFEVKVGWLEISSRSQYLCGVPFKIYSSIY